MQQSQTKVYVGNLSWNTTDETLRALFSGIEREGDPPKRHVEDAIVMRDRDTGRSRGFGFVTFRTAEEAADAIAMYNDTELDGRRIKVNLANVRPQGGGGGYSGGGGYGGGGGGYGGSGGGYGGNNGGGPPGGYGSGYPGGGYQGGGYQGGGYQGGYQSGSNTGYGGSGSGY